MTTELAESIKRNSTITQLDLSGNELGTGDCTALAEAVKHNSTITQLNLALNQLGTGDCTCVARKNDLISMYQDALFSSNVNISVYFNKLAYTL